MLKINRWLFATLFFHAHGFFFHYKRQSMNGKVKQGLDTIKVTFGSCQATDSFSSTLTTSGTPTSTETNATSTSTNTISTADFKGTTTLFTTAGTNINASTMTDYTIIVIGSILVVVAVVVAVVLIVVLVTVYYRRRKTHSNSGTNISMRNTGFYETHNEVLGQDNYEQTIMITPARENNSMDRVYNNEEPEYLQIEQSPPQNLHANIVHICI